MTLALLNRIFAVVVVGPLNRKPVEVYVAVVSPADRGPPNTPRYHSLDFFLPLSGSSWDTGGPATDSALSLAAGAMLPGGDIPPASPGHNSAGWPFVPAAPCFSSARAIPEMDPGQDPGRRRNNRTRAVKPAACIRSPRTMATTDLLRFKRTGRLFVGTITSSSLRAYHVAAIAFVRQPHILAAGYASPCSAMAFPALSSARRCSLPSSPSSRPCPCRSSRRP